MNIGGLQKTSLMDYPDTICAIIWTVGCNFRCPFCYNKDIVLGKVENILEKDIFSFLKKRKGMLEGLVISGGEPLMQKDIVNFTEKVKELGYNIKIDTNGMYPEKLKELIDKKLVDYVAMDIKAPKGKYDKLSGIKTDVKKIEKSIELIKNSAPDYEFKTTFVPGILSPDDILSIAKWLKDSKKYYLQQFRSDVPLISPDLENMLPYSKEDMFDILEKIKTYFKICNVRGI